MLSALNTPSTQQWSLEPSMPPRTAVRGLSLRATCLAQDKGTTNGYRDYPTRYSRSGLGPILHKGGRGPGFRGLPDSLLSSCISGGAHSSVPLRAACLSVICFSLLCPVLTHGSRLQMASPVGSHLGSLDFPSSPNPWKTLFRQVPHNHHLQNALDPTCPPSTLLSEVSEFSFSL